jgi:hypothetical protein
MVVGMTSVFVPQDLTYLGVTPEELHAESSRLIPLIAHDRAGFGGAIATCGVLVVLCVWYGRPGASGRRWPSRVSRDSAPPSGSTS